MVSRIMSLERNSISVVKYYCVLSGLTHHSITQLLVPSGVPACGFPRYCSFGLSRPV